jgi:hypothetical protein
MIPGRKCSFKLHSELRFADKYQVMPAVISTEENYVLASKAPGYSYRTASASPPPLQYLTISAHGTISLRSLAVRLQGDY